MHGRNWRIQMSFPMRMLPTKSFGIIKILLLTNNRFSKSICFVREVLKLGTCFLTLANFFKVRRYWQQIYPHATQYFKLGVVDAIPIAWRLIIKQSQTSQHFYSSFLGDKMYIELDDTEIDLSKVTSKLYILYNKFKTKKQTPPSAQNMMKNNIPNLWLSGKKSILYRLSSQ